MSKCIYCNAENDLSESDIIPDALTNLRITNKNVCRLNHNNKFSDLFESQVIDDFSYIANSLNIKSSKAKDYHNYKADILVDKNKYIAKKMSSDATLFKGKILKAYDDSHLLTTLEKAKQLAKNNEYIYPFNVNDSTIEKRVSIPTTIFFTSEIYRLMSKISFEWYCLKNDVAEVYSEFDNIIKYITTGDNDLHPVSIITDKKIYDKLNMISNIPGSHTLFGFIDSIGRVNIIISFFGILMYRVIVSNKPPLNCKHNLLFLEIRTDGSKYEISEENYYTAENEFKKCLHHIFNATGSTINYKYGFNFSICIADERSPKDIYNKYKYLSIILELIKDFDETTDFNGVTEENCNNLNDITNLILNNLRNCLSRIYLNTKLLKRFIKEHSLIDKEININFNNSNPNDIFIYCVIMRIGELNPIRIDASLYKQITKELLYDNTSDEPFLNPEIEARLKRLMLQKNNFIKLIKDGALIINKV